MKTLWQEDSRQEITRRLHKLTPDSRARWGKMNASQMVAHLNNSLRMAAGELATSPRNLAIRYPPLKQMIIYWLPFPKGVPTAPELLSGDTTDWVSATTALRQRVSGFATRDPGQPWPLHPAFGKLTSRSWWVLGYRHIDHHFKQFGV